MECVERELLIIIKQFRDPEDFLKVLTNRLKFGKIWLVEGYFQKFILFKNEAFTTKFLWFVLLK